MYWDQEFEERISRHQRDRGPEWTTIEVEKNIGEALPESKVVVIDCVTLWLSNVFYDFQQNIEPSLIFAKKNLDQIDARQEHQWIIITNELGMGLHADTPLGRKFVDLHGWVNQYLAQKADKVTMMVSGIAWELKP